MSGIIRVKKDARYFVASNEPFNDTRLTWEARGVMGYLLSKPDGWQCHNYDLVNKGPAGDYVIKRLMKELQQYGYLKRYRVSAGKNQIQWITEVYESPALNPDFSMGEYSTDEDTTDEFSTVEKTHDIVSTESVSTNSENTDTNSISEKDAEIEDFLNTFPEPSNGNTPKNATEAKARIAQSLADWQHAQDNTPTIEQRAADRLEDSGWQIRHPLIRDAAILFMAYTPFNSPPNGDATRKGWYKYLKEHTDEYPLARLPDLYRRATDRLFPANRPPDWQPPTGPWAYTKTMAGLEAESKTTNGKPKKSLDDYEKIYDMDGNWTGGYYGIKNV